MRSVEVKFDIVVVMLISVLHVTASVLVALFAVGTVLFMVSIAFLLVLLQLQHAVLEVALLPTRVLAERGAGRAATAHAQVVVSARLQGHGEAGGRGQVGDDLWWRGRWWGLRREGTVGVGFLQSVSHHGELELFFELSHQQAGAGGPGQHLWGATHGAVHVHGQLPDNSKGMMRGLI